MFKNSLIALSLLAAVVFAAPAPLPTSTATLNPGEYTLTLDTPPPGATQLRIRFVSITADMNWGRELVSTAWPSVPPVSYTQDCITQYILKDGSYPTWVDVVDTRVQATTETHSLTPDGTTDYGGTGGYTRQETKVKGTQPWVTYNGTPSSLFLYRRLYNGMLNGNPANTVFSTYYNVDQTVTVEWEWL